MPSQAGSFQRLLQQDPVLTIGFAPFRSHEFRVETAGDQIEGALPLPRCQGLVDELGVAFDSVVDASNLSYPRGASYSNDNTKLYIVQFTGLAPFVQKFDGQTKVADWVKY